MAMRGRLIGKGYIKGFGVGRVFQDMDNPDMLFVVKSNGQSRYAARSRVEFRK